MDEEIRALLMEWVQQQKKACDAQVEAIKLVSKISETLAVKDMRKKIEEAHSGKQLFLN